MRTLEVTCGAVLRPAPTPVEGILSEAELGAYDLIVLGRHAAPPGGRFRKEEDVSLRVLAGSGRSVLIVPADE